MIYNFRFDRSNVEELLRRIENNKQLSQGWGGGQEANLDLRNNEFASGYDIEARNQFEELGRMFMHGDTR